MSNVVKNTFLDKTYTVTLTVPKTIALTLGSLVLIGWFFFLGLLLGRGYEPENIVPQLAEMMPQPPLVALSSEEAPQPPHGVSVPEQSTQPNGRAVIAEADRAYRQSIRQEGEQQGQVSPPSLTPPQSAQQAATTSQGSEGTSFTYVYQLASFKEEKAAKSLQEKLAAAGYKPQITTTKGSKSTWYRITISFKGTEPQEQEIKNTLKKTFKLGEPLRLSKK